MKWIYRFFVALGVIFFFILIGVTYFVIADPLNLRPVVMSLYNSREEVRADETQLTNEQPQTSNDAPETTTNMMTVEQEQALEAVGISPTAVPAQFTPQQIECFTGILGEQRVNEIKAGDTPTMTEFYQAKDCV
ncbi:hypothetical protein K2P47_00870 [Patescibacteria group bacterium]|nr:hypothetical protein [Patescibacteria group bacterium]